MSPCIYPINMDSIAFVKLKSHVLNEGRIPFGKKSIGMLSYHNQDPVLIKYFTDIIRELGSFVGEPRLAPKALAVFASPVLARALNASGLLFGRKTMSDPPLDPILKKEPDLLKYHIQTTLTEEGWFSLTINRGRVYFGIAWGRSVDITDKLSRGQIEQLRQLTDILQKRKISMGRVVDPELLKRIKENPTKSFDQEIALLSSAHKERLLPAGYPTKLHLSKDERVTAFWEIHFTKPELVDLIYDEYGMLPGTWKASRFENLYRAYFKYRGRRLTDEEILEVRKIKEGNPPKISVEWIGKKMQELFPSVEWGGDLERIRKKLGRKGKG